MAGAEPSFEWDDAKDRTNRTKHGVGFDRAQVVFFDTWRVIADDLGHGGREQRYFCFSLVDGAVMTIRVHSAQRTNSDNRSGVLEKRNGDL